MEFSTFEEAASVITLPPNFTLTKFGQGSPVTLNYITTTPYGEEEGDLVIVGRDIYITFPTSRKLFGRIVLDNCRGIMNDEIAEWVTLDGQKVEVLNGKLEVTV